MRLSEIDWGEVYARIITHTGWSWEYVGEHMTLPRLQALSEHWAENPPGVHLGTLLGFSGASPKTSPGPEEYGTLNQFVEEFTALGGKVE